METRVFWTMLTLIEKEDLGGGPKMVKEQEGETTFSPTNSSEEYLNAE